MDLWLGNFDGGPAADETRPPGWESKWFTGVVFAAVLLAYGLECVISGHGIILGDWGISMELEGAKAVALGIACIGIAAFLHAHFFWGSIYCEYRAAVLVKVAGLAAFAGGLGFVIAKVFIGN